jgi:hypothetical protein
MLHVTHNNNVTVFYIWLMTTNWLYSTCDLWQQMWMYSTCDWWHQLWLCSTCDVWQQCDCILHVTHNNNVTVFYMWLMRTIVTIFYMLLMTPIVTEFYMWLITTMWQYSTCDLWQQCDCILHVTFDTNCDCILHVNNDT